MNRLCAAVLMAVALPHASALGQGVCNGSPLGGSVRDTTAALIPGATIVLDGKTERTSAADGRFRFPCVAAGPHLLAVGANGFARVEVAVNVPRPGDVEIRLQPSTEASVTVETDASEAASPSSSGVAGQTISGDKLQALADDPDDLQRQLQQMAAASGGLPSGATISVDGFQDSSALPPKSSIAYIKVNPDLFSAEYREPPFGGGRVEVYTKPGASAFHGALFTTISSPFMNARDPFSTSRASIGKQRFGFELNGPVRKKGSSFNLNLEHRSIDNFAVVNAVTLDGNGNPQGTIANVATPQRLWEGQARLDWQLGSKDIFQASYSANVNHLTNVGVGGTSLPETGADSNPTEHTIRFSNVWTPSAKLMHETRFSLSFRGQDLTPLSTAPQVQVAGSFTGGGASSGPYSFREFRTEWNDDVVISTKEHLIKAGLQLITSDEHRRLTTDFNGSYIFGGGSAPVLDGSGTPTGQTATISGLEQYRRALRGQPGGTPTAFSGVSGDPQVNFLQSRAAVFFQDDWKLRPNVLVTLGLRYFIQNDPLVLNSIAPRAGIIWTPDKKKTWQLHAHGGLFNGQYGAYDWQEFLREDGVQRITSTVYNPAYGNPLASGAVPIYSKRTLAPGLHNIDYAAAEIGASKTLPGGWTLQAQLVGLRLWDDVRTLNINTPLDGNPYGVRPIMPNVNILEAQNSGAGVGDGEFVAVEQHQIKWLQLFFGTVRINLRDNTDDDLYHSPQSAYTDAGEFSRRTDRGLWQSFGNATFKLPGKVQLSGNYNGSGKRPYNILTGFDNNGDGNFNDRPRFAVPGQGGAVQTPFGTLVASGGTGTLRRNLGMLPWQHYLDANVQRSWGLTRDKKAEHQQTLTFNVRSSNALNHLNVTSVGGVLGSPLFGVPYAADNGRRIEGGLRYSF